MKETICDGRITVKNADELTEREFLLLDRIEEYLKEIPFINGKAYYMFRDSGFFFDLDLTDAVRLTFSKYDDDDTVYLNIMENGEVILQNSIPEKQMIDALKDYFNNIKKEKDL